MFWKSLCSAALAALCLSGCGGSSENFVITGGPSTQGVAASDSYRSLGNVSLSVTADRGLLANDSDGSVVLAETLTTAFGGTVVIESDGSFRYTPPPRAAGATTDSFSYRLSSGAVGQVNLNLPAYLIFVDVAAAPNGDGSEAKPFQTIPPAIDDSQNGDIIYLVYNQTTPHLFSGTLPAGIALRGQGTPVSEGDLALLSIAHSRLRGKVTLFGGNLVSGLQLENPGDEGLLASGVDNLTISDNIFSLLDIGIDMGDVDELEIVRNQFLGTDDDPEAAVNLTFSESGDHNVRFENNTFATDSPNQFNDVLTAALSDEAGMTLAARDNTTLADGGHYAVSMSGSTQLSADIEGNRMDGGQQGVQLQAGAANTDGTHSTITVSDNTIVSTDSGVDMRAQGTTGTVHSWTVTENTISGAGTNGIYLQRFAGCRLNADIASNIISGAGSAAISVASNPDEGPDPAIQAGEDHLSITQNNLAGNAVGILLNLFSQVGSTRVANTDTNGSFQFTLDSLTSHLQLQNNDVAGTISVMVDAPFTLIVDDSDQTAPTPTYSGGGTVSDGPFVP